MRRRQLVTSKHVSENVKERPDFPSLKRTPYPHVRPNPQEGGGVTEKNRNLKAAKIFCKTPLHREMNKEYKELFLDFSMNK